MPDARQGGDNLAPPEKTLVEYQPQTSPLIHNDLGIYRIQWSSIAWFTRGPGLTGTSLASTLVELVPAHICWGSKSGSTLDSAGTPYDIPPNAKSLMEAMVSHDPWMIIQLPWYFFLDFGHPWHRFNYQILRKKLSRPIANKNWSLPVARSWMRLTMAQNGTPSYGLYVGSIAIKL